MNGKRLRAVGLAGLGALFQAGCSQPLDLCADAAGACLTVQASSDSTDPVDLLRALYTVGADSTKELQFMSPPGGSPLPAGFALNLATSGAVNLDVIAELNLRPTLHGSAQVTLADGEHQQVTVNLTADLSSLPYVGPPPRHHAGMVYSPARKAVVLFGGIGGDGSYLNDTWELSIDSGAWTAYTANTAIPTARAATLAYDPTLQRVVLTSGLGSSGMAVQDLWSYDATGTWAQAPAGNHGGGNRQSAGMTVTDNGIAIVAGGVDPQVGTILQDVVTFDPASALKNGPDFVTHLPAMAVPQIKTPKLVNISAPVTSDVYLLGADEASPSSGIGVWQIKGVFSTPGSLLSVTSVVTMDPAAPSHRTDFAVTADADAGLIYVVGGTSVDGQRLQDAYVFNVNNKQWAQISATPSPTARAAAQLALLPPAVLLLGGQAAAGSTPPVALDNWKLTTSPFTAPTLPGVFVRRP